MSSEPALLSARRRGERHSTANAPEPGKNSAKPPVAGSGDVGHGDRGHRGINEAGVGAGRELRPTRERTQNQRHVTRLNQVVGPPQQRPPHIRREVIDNVLRQREGREEGVGAHVAGDEETKTQDRAGLWDLIDERVRGRDRIADARESVGGHRRVVQRGGDVAIKEDGHAPQEL